MTYLKEMFKRFSLASAKFLKVNAEVLALPLGNIINLLITLSTFPEECKIAKLNPIFKKGARNDPKNYRPISLLPLVSKMIERSICISQDSGQTIQQTFVYLS